MKLMPCPLNGLRNISEFVCHGEIHSQPNPDTTSDKDWGDYIWLANNTAGVVREWWCHTPTNYWFVAERNTVTDDVIRTYPSEDLDVTGGDRK